MPSPLSRVIAELDRRHRQDPAAIEVDGAAVPKEWYYAQRMSAWLDTLVASPSDVLRIAVCAQHLQRWELARDAYPNDRIGYLTWRRDQGQRAGEIAATVMREQGYDHEEAERVQTIVRKQGLGRDADVQALEDCACLVFLELDFLDFAARVERDHMIRILQKTWRKMSPEAHQQALALPLPEEALSLVSEALGG
ncbi:DUF4202 domain-containing protein [Halomonas dongshanensis]|uniref:DUF4202 domain-containing protein n=1 Tax=Halomonas dongshanensis TaxID=2890835 RepID=A0ABT2EBP9_9GAMM|nr:DUF4202 domain-containing protein [Halomonas dongshanensis]MCS2608970.1 DUF4202 domain-containing protein [Halomonas dongshanensis]